MTITLDLSPFIVLNDDQLFELCRRHAELKIERSAKGELEIMPPTGGSSGRRNAWLTHHLLEWAASDGSGIVFDSSTLFKLPSGAHRGPDAAWVSNERWNALTPQQKDRFPPLCPDFVVELASPSDSLSELRLKMKEYLENGARLGWLLEPQTATVEIYRPQCDVETLVKPASLSGEGVLPGFILDLSEILL